jgi:DUF438 domain-containing protein
MTDTMTMNRLIHQAVRRDFDRLSSALSAYGGTQPSRAKGLERAYANLQGELTRHHEQEDHLIWPMLANRGVDQELLATMESEHQDMSQALAETGAAMKTFASSGSATDLGPARESLKQTRAVVIGHLDHEERDLEPLLLPHLESDEWKEVERKLRKQPPKVAGQFFAWLTDGMTDEGRSYLKGTVPTPVVFVLGRVLGRRYHKEIAPVWHAAA